MDENVLCFVYSCGNPIIFPYWKESLFKRKDFIEVINS